MTLKSTQQPSTDASGRTVKVLVSGGGTGGHIFPALSIADACRRRLNADILFVGAEGRMEMQRVPEAGYPIKALPVAGFNRKNLLKNFSVLLKLRRSMSLARKIVKDFKPDVVVGVGGYASGPTLKVAQKMGIPTLLQEQNSYAGVTNKLLAAKARAICVAYGGMHRFFPEERIVMTGNPVRKDLFKAGLTPADARKAFGLDPAKPTLLVVGGSLGARTVNESVAKFLPEIINAGLQVIWQTGKSWTPAPVPKGCIQTPFLSDMAAAYTAATLVVSRAGAGTISELQLLGKPCVLVPSPNVAEDHQTKNARALADVGAAVLVPDADCRELLWPEVKKIISDPEKPEAMAAAIKKLALPDSDEKIVDQIERILNNE